MLTTTKQITVLIADDHEITRQGIRSILEQTPDIHVLGEAENGDEIRQLVTLHQPQILLSDLIMPNHSPMELEKWVRTNYPETITLVLTAHDRSAYLAGMLDAGAAGYLDKRLRSGQLVSAIRRAASGEFLFDKQQLARARRWREEVSQKWESLSMREQQVLQLLTEGMGNNAIASSLQIKINTVEKHLQNIYQKLDLRTRAEAILWWMERDT